MSARTRPSPYPRLPHMSPFFLQNLGPCSTVALLNLDGSAIPLAIASENHCSGIGERRDDSKADELPRCVLRFVVTRVQDLGEQCRRLSLSRRQGQAITKADSKASTYRGRPTTQTRRRCVKRLSGVIWSLQSTTYGPSLDRGACARLWPFLLWYSRSSPS